MGSVTSVVVARENPICEVIKMEETYFCLICGRRHKPYEGLIYTEHLNWAVKSKEEAKEGFYKAHPMFLKILDDFESFLPETEFYLKTHEAKALASYFRTFPIEFYEDRVVIKFGRLTIHAIYEDGDVDEKTRSGS